MTLKEYLDWKKLSRAEFAAKANISLPTLSKYLTGKMMLSSATLAKIVRAAEGDVTYEDLVESAPKAGL